MVIWYGLLSNISCVFLIALSDKKQIQQVVLQQAKRKQKFNAIYCLNSYNDIFILLNNYTKDAKFLLRFLL